MAEDAKQVAVEHAEKVDVQALIATLQGDGKGLSRMQWVSVVGVGTFLIVPVVFWMMHIINGTLSRTNEVIQDNTVAISAAKEQSDDVESALRSTRRAVEKLADLIGPDEDAEDAK